MKSVFLIALFAAFISANAADLPSALMEERHLDILEQYCLDCHDSDTEKGQINLEDLSLDLGSDVQMAERWQEVLNAGEMPPEDKDQLTVAEKTDILAHLSEKIVVARQIHADDGGVITMRRLNQREYANTLEDLLGVRPEVDGLPTDQGSGGYDTAGASLYLSSDQFEQYMAIAREALVHALGSAKAVEPSVVRVEAENKYYSQEAHQALYDQYQDERVRGSQFKEAYRKDKNIDPADFGFKLRREAHFAVTDANNMSPILEEYLSRPEISTGYIMMGLHKRIRRPITTKKFVSVAGEEVTIRFRAASYPEAPARFRYVEVIAQNWTDNNATNLGARKVRASIDDPEIIEIKTKLIPGKHTEFRLQWRQQQTGSKPDGKVFLEQKERQYHTPMAVWLDWVEVDRPRPTGWPYPRVRQIPLSDAG